MKLYEPLREYLDDAKKAGDIRDYKLDVHEDGTYDLLLTVKYPLKMLKLNIIL